MKGVVSWFAENHVAANLLMLFLLFAGAVTGLTMKIEVFPEFSLDRITVTTEYPGASPAEVEEAIIRRIEERVAGLAGIKRIDSTARESFGTVTIEVMEGWDLKKLLDEVKAEVDSITTFPKEAEKPIVREMTRRSQVISLAVYGDASESTIKNLAEKIKNEITDLPGITQADLFGVRKGEIHVEISEETLRRHGLTLGKVADAVRRGSLDLPAGRVKTGAGEVLIRTKGRRYYAAEYRDLPVITYADGTKVTLGQIADLSDGFEDLDLFARFQGKPSAVIQVYRVADQSALEVAETVKEYAERVRPSLPAGVDIGFYQDMSIILKSRIELLLKNMAFGLILVSILLGMFLDIRLAFWVTLGIPISFLSGLWMLPQFDISINMVSLFAFIMVLGIVVDDAIIVGENVFRKHEEGEEPLRGAVDGTVEVGRPVIFAVLTTVVAFWPLLLGSGTMGKIMRNLPIVVILVLMGSLVESLLILPAHLNRSRKREARRIRGTKKETLVSRGLKWVIQKPYARLVNSCVRWRYATVALGIAVLLLSVGVWKGGWIQFTFFPKVESDLLVCTLTMPAGTPVSETVAVVNWLEQTAKETLAEMDKKRPEGAPPLFEYSVSLVGMHTGGHGPTRGSPELGGNLAQIFVQLLEGERRDVSAMKLVKMWRERAGIVPDAESITFQSELFSAGNPVEVHLSLDDHNQLLAAADDLKEELAKYPGTFDISDSFLPGKEEMQLKLKPAARSLGLTLSDLAQQVRHAFYGAEALRLQRDQDEVKVLVRYPEEERRSLGHVKEMRIRTSGGKEVPFSQVAEVNMEHGYASIQRAQRLRVVKVTADIDEGVTNANEVRMDVESQILPRLKHKYPGLRYTIEGEGKEQKESLSDVIQGFAIALFCIYALLAIPFRSFSQPFIVMAAIPFGIVGAIAGHLIMGLNLSLLSLFGMVGLAGVVVNDSLVLIYATNRLREEGASAQEAVTRAGALRFRAIILTSLTTFAGLAPMIMEKSLQAQFLIPMAVSLGFGVLFATGITLLLVPCGYVILDDLQNLLTRQKPE
ncbi:MAG: efflux RND transporter permease subunit [Desulfobacterales bacterium]|nr:efflux RND transporter permease subunit [Desulfobacterales bacterium]MBL7101419.1 efflux RND transporter permease subunit [Desulfobacteraceae bacterium]MBL7171540.1 efflux RND transporter permease subunit [Desulfobacteraceae bacterium]